MKLRQNKFREANFKIENTTKFEMEDNSLEQVYSFDITNTPSNLTKNQFSKNEEKECQKFQMKFSSGDDTLMKDNKIGNGSLEFSNIRNISISGLMTEKVILDVNDATSMFMQNLTLIDSKLQFSNVINSFELDDVSFLGNQILKIQKCK